MPTLNVNLINTPTEYEVLDIGHYDATVLSQELIQKKSGKGHNIALIFEIESGPMGSDEPEKSAGSQPRDWVPTDNLIKLKRLILACHLPLPEGDFETEDLEGCALKIQIGHRTEVDKDSGENKTRHYVKDYFIPQEEVGASDTDESKATETVEDDD